MAAGRLFPEPRQAGQEAQTVAEVTDKPISLDSAKPDLLVQVVPKVKEALPETKLVVNSSTAAADAMAKLVPLAAEHNASIIGLTMDQEGVPGDVEKRVECGAMFLMTAMESGIQPEDIYIDPIILPVNVASKQPWNVMEAIRQLAIANDPPPHFIMGLSNVSQQCLMNELINRTYLVMSIAAGLDAAIMDPLDEALVSAVRVAEVLTGKDRHCRRYARAFRGGLRTALGGSRGRAL